MKKIVLSGLFCLCAGISMWAQFSSPKSLFRYFDRGNICLVKGLGYVYIPGFLYEIETDSLPGHLFLKDGFDANFVSVFILRSNTLDFNMDGKLQGMEFLNAYIDNEFRDLPSSKLSPKILVSKPKKRYVVVKVSSNNMYMADTSSVSSDIPDGHIFMDDYYVLSEKDGIFFGVKITLNPYTVKQADVMQYIKEIKFSTKPASTEFKVPYINYMH